MTTTACDDQLRSRCQACGIDFARPRQADVPDGYCTRCWSSAEAFSAAQADMADAWDRDRAITDIAVAMSPDNWPEGRTVHHKGHDITWEEYVTRQHELEEEFTVEPWPEERMDAIGTNGPAGDHRPPTCADGLPCGVAHSPGDDAYCLRCPHEPLDAEGQEEFDASMRIFTEEPFPKQARYQDARGEDWIDEFARTATPEELRGAMRFTIGKYNRRAGKKDALVSEIMKIEDYARRWREYELARVEGEA